ncbi:MAG: RNA methyltransferase [Chitinivorax sp.]
MMQSISSAQNPFIKQLQRLGESARERRKAQQALLEGIHLAQTCIDAGTAPQRCILAESAAAHVEIRALLARIDPQCVVQLPDALFGKLFELQAQVGIVLLIDIPAPRPALRDGCAVLLEDIQDPGNVGTILRTAAAAGVDTIYLSPACADCWSPKVLRAAMGAHFGINIVERANLPQVAGDFAGSVIATHLAAAVSLYSLDLTGPVAIVFGNEGQGVSADLLQQVDTRAIIPMSGRTESLNVGAAAAICLFERVRQLAVLQRR